LSIIRVRLDCFETLWSVYMSTKLLI